MPHHFRKIIYAIGALILSVCAGLIIWFNVQLYYPFQQSGIIARDQIAHLHFIRDAIRQHADSDMQEVYPEGYVFMNALYGLAWYNIIVQKPLENTIANEAKKEIHSAWKRIHSAKGKSTFDSTLSIPYGAFYAGWDNYLLGSKLLITKPAERDSNEVLIFRKNCESIARVLHNASTPFPSSYENKAWPEDGVVCAASLGIHDKIFEPEYHHALKLWVDHVKSTTKDSSLIAHETDATTGKLITSARGSSQSLMLIFLLDIDTAFARQQFNIYRKQFVDFTFGLPSIREYPIGTDGGGDIDSGPIIFGSGAAATIVGMRTMSLYNEPTLAYAIRNSIEGFGMASSTGDSKNYLFAQFPIADAFIAWANTTPGLQDVRPEAYTWRNEFHMYSVAAMLVLVATLIVARRYIRSS